MDVKKWDKDNDHSQTTRLKGKNTAKENITKREDVKRIRIYQQSKKAKSRSKGGEEDACRRKASKGWKKVRWWISKRTRIITTREESSYWWGSKEALMYTTLSQINPRLEENKKAQSLQSISWSSSNKDWSSCPFFKANKGVLKNRLCRYYLQIRIPRYKAANNAKNNALLYVNLIACFDDASHAPGYFIPYRILWKK